MKANTYPKMNIKSQAWLWVMLVIVVLLGVPAAAEAEAKTVLIARAGSFSAEEAEARGLSDKVIMIKSKYCSNCKATQPDFERACRELGIEPIILDAADKSVRQELKRYKLEVMVVPTFIFGADYYVGSMDSDEYLELLGEFLEE